MKFVLILIHKPLMVLAFQELCLVCLCIYFWSCPLGNECIYIVVLNVQQQALTVLEYVVANGSERVIEEIREHAYQISVIFCQLKHL